MLADLIMQYLNNKQLQLTAIIVNTQYNDIAITFS